MAQTPASSAPSEKSASPAQLGFLTVLHEASGFLGGYLVTNLWGRPLEFRLSSAVQPNRVQQILYGGTLQPYICADLIGKTLVEKAGLPVQMVLTDRELVLDLRHKLEIPVLWITPGEDAKSVWTDESVVSPPTESRGAVRCHPRYPQDVAGARQLLDRLEGAIDLAEPFTRIREAIGEARKMGVTSR
jgi:hypothetical protein